MAEKIQDKITMPLVNQVGIVVKGDLERVAENYWNKVGIGPWDIYALEPPAVFDTSYYGKPASYGFKIGLCRCGACELELIEPQSGDSVYRDFSTKHGEGLQHMQHIANTIAEAKTHVKQFVDMGFPLIMEGYFGDGYYACLDTRGSLKSYWEVWKNPSKMPGHITRIPADPSQKSPALIKIQACTQSGMVVSDVRQVVRNYSDILGMGPWGLLLNEPPLLHDLTYKGKPGNFTMTAAFGPGDVQLEPIEPHSGENIYADFIKEHGEGIHHLQFISTNMDETIELMSESGYHVLQGAWFNDGRAAYFDTVDELKCIWEAVQLPTIMPPVEHYP